MPNISSLRAVALLLCAPLALPASETPPPAAVSSPSALAAAVSSAPALLAARARATAARARLGAAGRFPDPEIEGMYSRKTTPDETMPMWEVNLRQPLPKAGERAADHERAAAVVAMADADFALMAGEMAGDIAMALAEAETARRRTEAVTQQITRAEQALTAIDARLATGQGRLGDRLALQTRLAAMQLMIEKDRRMAEDALADARARLGLPPAAPLPAFAAPSAADIDPEHAPALLVATAKNNEARAMARMARAGAKPMTAVALRLEREQERMGNNDTVGIAFMTELPWRARGYARAEERAAQADASAALADAGATRHRIAAALARAERAERLAEISRRLAQDTQKRLAAEYDALVRAAGTGGMGNESAVLMIIEVLEKSTDAELQVIDAEGSALLARAELWRHAPARFFPTP